MEVAWVGHLIDFFVIFFADVVAAYVGIRYFESRHADRQRTESSLSDLHRGLSQLQGFFHSTKESYDEDENTQRIFQIDYSADVKVFFSFNVNLLFWSFRSAKIYRPLYDSLRSSVQEFYEVVQEGDLEQYFESILQEIQAFQSLIERDLIRK